MTMRWPRVGSGIDVHPFADDDRPLRLGGVTVPGSPGLAGHSDGDAVCHVLVDALLGAIGGGDIGSLAGIDDPVAEGADSRRWLTQAAEACARGGWAIGNLDVTICAQRPRIGPHRAAMRAALAEACGIDPAQVSIKATTTDHLGFVGRMEGIAVLATAVVVPDGSDHSS